MIIEELLLHNVGVFRGEHRAVLTPPDPKKPVILFGGLNGAGKTTLLEAMQLVLYGRQSASGRRNDMGYEEYLRRMINRHANPRDGAAVQVILRVSEEGETYRLQVRRTWVESGSKIVERLEVFRDGELDIHLSETWAEYVGRLIPAQLSQLFFFDGERIEALADPDQSMEMLQSAVHALLGVDLVRQLQDDLLVSKRRKQVERRPGPEKARLEELENSVLRLKDRLLERKQTGAGLQAKLDQAKEKLRQIERDFARQGGELAENRQAIEVRQQELKARKVQLEGELRLLAAGALPMTLVHSLLGQIQVQSSMEADAHRASSLHALAEERDARLLKVLSSAVSDRRLMAKITELFDHDRQVHLVAPACESMHNLDDQTRSQIDRLLDRDLSEEVRRTQSVLEPIDEVNRFLDETERKLAAIPDSEAIADLAAVRSTARLRCEVLRGELASAEAECGATTRELEAAERAWGALAEQARSTDVEHEDADRFILHAERGRETLEKFRIAVTQRHASRLEGMILEGFHRLLRKQKLVRAIKIDPDTCRLVLQNADGQDLPAERLSAGERQLLAVSILWGLGKASGRSLPVIIDTPLGRLDTAHRMHLVERYFPFASHQVILLSTDEEIKGEYLAELKPKIGRCYRLIHDDAAGSSSIEQGYFDREAVLC